jgi:hypothetical protein
LVEGAILYAPGVTIGFWEELTYYYPRRVNHKASLPVGSLGWQFGKSNKSIILVKFVSLPHRFKLLEGNIHD